MGETYTEIAAEKAEIIKERCLVALAPQHPEARAVVEKVAAERKAPIVEVKKNLWPSSACLMRDADGLPIAQQFDVETDSDTYPQLTIPLLGHHQFVNATTAIAAIECLKQKGYTIPKTSVYAGFKSVQWPGRLQRIMSSPIVVLDGAHSRASMAALCSTIHQSFRYDQLTFIVSLMKDKNLIAIGNIISRTADVVIATQVLNNPRVMPAEDIQDAWKNIAEQITTAATPEKAITKALADASPTDLICITGSLYLVGQALAWLSETVSN